MTRSPFKHLISDTDRHGNVRHYVRLPGRPKVRIRAPYLDENGCITEEFTRAYREALEHRKEHRKEQKENRSKGTRVSDTFLWLFEQYRASSEFEELDEKTKNKKIGVLRPFP